MNRETPIELGSCALDILIALVEKPGSLVGKRELMARVWPGVFVVEGNSGCRSRRLRRALGEGRSGDGFIVTIPGRDIGSSERN
jgi:DNA-binding winged helix-turn-helix (wHTH) protein